MKYSFLKINSALFSVALLLSTQGVQAHFPTTLAALFSTSKKRIDSFFDTKDTDSCAKHLGYLQETINSFDKLHQEVDLQNNLSASSREKIKVVLQKARDKFNNLRNTIMNNSSLAAQLALKLKTTFGGSSVVMKEIAQDITHISQLLSEQGMPCPDLETLATQILQSSQKEAAPWDVVNAIKHRLNCK